MRNRLRSVLCWSALFLGFALTSANAAESRLFSFSFACDGQFRLVTLNAGGLGVATTRFLQGAEIAIFDNPDSLSFIVLEALTDPNKTLLSLSKGERRASKDFEGFFQASTNAAGIIPFTLAGTCTGGGVIQGLANIGFF